VLGDGDLDGVARVFPGNDSTPSPFRARPKKNYLDNEFFLGILAIDGHGSITKTQTIHPDETSGSARGGHLGGQ